MSNFVLKKDNYFSLQASNQYMGVSQLKSWIDCEAHEHAVLHGEWTDEDKEVFLQGHYVHSWSEGKLQEFIAAHPEIISSRGATKGCLKKEFQICDAIINTLKNDEVIMDFLTGEKEQIFTAELWGVPWKIMVDVLNVEGGFFTDLKVMRDITEKFWSAEYSDKVNFVLQYHYDWQMAVYAEVLKRALGAGEYLEPFIVCASKPSDGYPDKAVVSFGTEFIRPTLDAIEPFFRRIIEAKEGRREPARCGRCAYCRATKKLTYDSPVFYREL